MKISVQVKLVPEAAVDTALRETLALCNIAANHTSRQAFETGITNAMALQRLVYGELKSMGLSAQPTIHCVR